MVAAQYDRLGTYIKETDIVVVDFLRTYCITILQSDCDSSQTWQSIIKNLVVTKTEFIYLYSKLNQKNHDTQLKIVISAKKYTTHIRCANNCSSITGRKILMMATTSFSVAKKQPNLCVSQNKSMSQLQLQYMCKTVKP